MNRARDVKGAGGGAYLRGAGESQLEMDKRLFNKRISRLKAELADLEDKRGINRNRRRNDDRLPLVCLVGYTNAGKTSLLNALSEAAPRAAKESEIPNFKGSYLGRFPLVSADFWTSDHLSERSRSVDAFSGTRARGTLTLKRR